MELGYGSWGYINEDASRKHLRVMLFALVVSVKIHLDVRGEFFNCELSIFTLQVVGLEAHLDFSDVSGAGYPSGLVALLGETCCDLEDFSGGAIKLIERQCCGRISVPLFAYVSAVVDDQVGGYLDRIASIYMWWFRH